MYPLQSIILEAFFVRKEKLFVSAVIKDNGDVIIWSKGHDYDAKSEEVVLNKQGKTRGQRSHKRIYLENRIYNTWQQLKYEGTCKTDSSFAAYLISLELKRREKQVNF